MTALPAEITSDRSAATATSEGGSATMLLTYKHRLNPEKRQHRALERILEQQRILYNAALEERILAWAKGKSISEVDQSRSLTVIRGDDPAFALVQRRIQRATLKRLDRSYKAFFRRAKAGAGASSGFPKFKGREHFDGFNFDAFAQITLKDGGLRFAGMPGKLRVYLDRPLPEVADPETGEMRSVIKGVWFKREGLRLVRRQISGLPNAVVVAAGNRWYVGLQCEVPVKTDRAGCGKGAIGVDWGTSVLAALSSGETIGNPRHGEQLAKELARAQRAVSRKKKGGRGRLKARRHLAAVQRKTANRRRTTMDKLSKRLVTHFGTVATEVIDAKGLMNAERPGETLPVFVKTRRNREALDAAPYLLRQMTDYKALLYGARHVEVEPGRFTDETGKTVTVAPTQECTFCGRMHFKELSEPEHVCTTPGPHFGMRLPRKVNAAKVILRRGLMQLDAAKHSTPQGDDNGGGPVPGGLSGRETAVRNARTGARRLGNTEGEQSPTGRRSKRSKTGTSNGEEPPTHTRGTPTRPRPERTSGW